MAWMVEWFVFTGIASYLIYDGYNQEATSDKSIRLFLSFLFWVASGYQWNLDHPGSDLMLVHVAMILLSLFWSLASMGHVIDRSNKVKGRDRVKV